jgi:exopolysaccharide production protein ExoY
VAIVIAPPEAEVREGASLVSLFADGARRPRRLAVGPAAAAQALVEILHGRRNGKPHAIELVPSNGELTDWLRRKAPDEVFFLLDEQVDQDLIGGAGAQLLMDGVSLHFVLPPMPGPPVWTGSARLGGRPCISLHAVREAGGPRSLRRFLDVFGAILLLVGLSPLVAVVAALVWWRMGRPVLYVQQRVGERGKPFGLYKFRSMVPDADGILRTSDEMHRRYVACNYKLPEAEDPRITRLGRFLRRTSLDELPQLWNVLRGDMSLVGPRPVVPEEVREYGDYARLLLRVKPGLTGAWQVSGRSAVGYPERAHLDLYYVAARALSDDLRILARTLPAVLRRRGAV